MCVLVLIKRASLFSFFSFFVRCANIIQMLTTDTPMLGECHVGKTLVLYRSQQHKMLETRRTVIVNEATRTCQRYDQDPLGRVTPTHHIHPIHPVHPHIVHRLYYGEYYGETIGNGLFCGGEDQSRSPVSALRTDTHAHTCCKLEFPGTIKRIS